MSDAEGVVRLEVPAGLVTVLVTKDDFLPVGASVEAVAGQEASLETSS